MWAKTLVSTATARLDLDTVLLTSDCTEQGYHPNQQYPVLPITLPTKYKVPPTRPTVSIDGQATVFLQIAAVLVNKCFHAVCVWVWVVRGSGRCYRRSAGRIWQYGSCEQCRLMLWVWIAVVVRAQPAASLLLIDRSAELVWIQ